MAMTAQQYLATLPAAEQQQVQASLASSGSSLQQWFQAAIDAGDPRAVRAVGGAEIEGGGGSQAVAGGAASSEWVGKRKPTPSELVAHARQQGWSEDFARYEARQLAAWIANNWDVAGGHFLNDFGDVVEKPTESGPKSIAAGFATGERGGGRGGGGGGGAGAPAGGITGGASGPLANALFRQWAQGEGQFGLVPGQPGQTQVASTLPGGGLWWGQQAAPAAAPTGGAPAGTPGAATTAPAVAPAVAAAGKAAPAPAMNFAPITTSLSGLFGATPSGPATLPGTSPGGGGIDLSQFLPADVRARRSPLSTALADSGDWNRGRLAM